MVKQKHESVLSLVVLGTLIFLFISSLPGCSVTATRPMGVSTEKSIVGSVRTSTLRIHVESAPIGASVIFQFSDWLQSSSPDTTYYTPCDLEVGHTEETVYSDGSKERKGVLGGNFAFSHAGIQGFKMTLYSYWDDTPTPEDLRFEPFCVPLHIELQGYSPVDTTVCFDRFADEVKSVKVVLGK